MVNHDESGTWMAKKSESEEAKTRSGPRAPAGKRPLTVIIDEKLIKAAKVAAIGEETNVSRVVQELLKEWLAGLKTRK